MFARLRVAARLRLRCVPWQAVQGMVQGIKDRGADEAGLAEMGDEWDGAVAAMLAAEEKEREREQQREGGGAAAGAAR